MATGRFRQEKWRFGQLLDNQRLPGTSEPYGAPTPAVTSIYQHQAGYVMFGTFNGLVVFTQEQNKWERFMPDNSAHPGSKVTAITEDAGSRIWIATDRGVLILKQ
jgi:ligand-binding sensor domain-containing protein